MSTADEPRPVELLVRHCNKCSNGITEKITHGGWVSEYGFCDCNNGIAAEERILGIVLRRQLIRKLISVRNSRMPNAALTGAPETKER